ncbi:MAG TPA: metal-dependent hydrolase [Alphaproteobacteria bacterium]|nr:metal-dependent hydrolase [Alphaproteobacteria bacterium]
MFIAHLPAGYILATFLKDKKSQLLLLTGSIAPDFDLIYFYTIGQRAVVHHAYPTHMPYFWILLSLGGILFARLFGKNLDLPFLALLCGAILHLFLDSVTGGIHWLSPFSDKELIFFDVPASFSHWTLNFILHWTFLFEIGIIFFAGFLFFRRRN